jgi:hypothetical protein
MSRLIRNSRSSNTCPCYTVCGKICDDYLEQWIIIKFCVKIRKRASEKLALSTLAYGEYAMMKFSTCEWHSIGS